MEEIRTIEENPVEEIDTLEESIQTIIIGVESLDGQTGNLTTKTINGQAILGEGNIETATASDIASAVAVEKSAREEADAGLQTAINGKQDALTQTQLSAVNSGIDSTKVAQIATNAGNIADIDAVIPNQASSSNQLADRNFVNSSISTNTANYISNNGEPFTSVEQLEAYSGVVTNNDYAFVVGTDSAGNVTYTRYKYNSTTGEWAEEYVLNNSSFTSDQWATINSGITSGDVTKLAGIQAGAQVNTIESISVNGTPITPDVNKNVAITTASYTAGAGLTLEGNEFSVTEPAPAGYFSDTNATVSGEGTDITLNNTSSSVLKDYQLKGDTKQTTYTGKNKLSNNETSWSFSTADGRISSTAGRYAQWGSITGGQTYTASRKEVGGSSYYIIAFFDSEPAVGSTALSFKRADAYATSLSITDDAPASATYAVVFYGSALSDEGQLEAGSTATSYEPYVGGLPSPSPDYPEPISVVTGDQTVKVTGKNLFSGNYSQFNNQGGTGSTYDYFQLPSDSDYTLTLIAKNAIGVQSPNKFIGFSSNGGSSSGTLWAWSASSTATAGQKFTVWNKSSNVNRLYVSMYPNNETTFNWFVNNFDIQLELGSTATAYEPYQGYSYTISLGALELAKIGTYQDYIYKSAGNWYKHTAISKVTYDGSEAWSKVNLAFQTTATSDKSATSGAFSDYFTFFPTQSGITQGIPNGQFGWNTTKVPTFRYDSCADASAFKTWLSTHNTTVYYLLDTATDTQITDTALIAQLEALWNARSVSGQTIISNSAVSPNLAGILTVDAFKNNLVGTNAGYTEEIARLQAEMNSSLANIETALHTINNGGN